PDVHALGGGVIPHIVRIVTELNDPTGAVVVGAQQLETFALAVRDCYQLRVRHNGDSLRLAKPGHTLDVSAGSDVEDFDRIVAKRCDIQAPGCPIEGQMIDAAFDSRKVDGPRQREWLLRRA